jgi:hypothetical protein
MTNLAFQDILGGSINVYSKDTNLPRLQRIKNALHDLRHMGDIKVYLYKGNKLRLLFVKRK